MKNFFIIFLSIILLGSLLRIYNLTHFPIFGDEAIYVRWSQQMRDHSELRFVPLSDGKQPLFMWSIIPFLKIFEDPLFAGRFVSVLTGTATMLGVFVLGIILFARHPIIDQSKGIEPRLSISKLLGKNNNAVRAALIAMFFYAISPFTVFFDRMALTDSMLAMFGVWTLIFALLTAILVRLDTAMITGFMLGGAFLTKSPALFFAVLLPVTVFYFRQTGDGRHHQKRSGAKDLSSSALKSERSIIAALLKARVQLKRLFLLFVSYLIAYGMYNILRLGPNFHMLQTRTLDYVYPYSHVLSSPLDPLLPFLDRIFEYYWLLAPGVVLILAFFAGYRLLKRKTFSLIILVVWLVLPTLIVAEFSRTLTARYVYFAVPYLFILASGIVFYKKPLRKIFYFSVVVIAILSLRWSFIYHTDLNELPLPQSERSGYLQEWTSGIGIIEVREFMDQEVQRDPEQEFLIGTEGHFGTLPQGLEIYYIDQPRVEVVGVGIGLEKIPEVLVRAKQENKQVFLVINNERLDIDPLAVTDRDPSLRFVNEFPKVKREDGTQQKLQLFEIKKV